MVSLEKLKPHLQKLLADNQIHDYKAQILTTPSLTLQICIANDDGTMDLDTCDKISKLISQLLDEIDTDDDAYMLDVCSFGAEREFDSLQEVENYTPGYVHIELKNPKDGLDKFDGTLTECKDGVLNIEYFVKGRKKTAVVDYQNVRLIRQAVKL